MMGYVLKFWENNKGALIAVAWETLRGIMRVFKTKHAPGLRQGDAVMVLQDDKTDDIPLGLVYKVVGGDDGEVIIRVNGKSYDLPPELVVRTIQ